MSEHVEPVTGGPGGDDDEDSGWSYADYGVNHVLLVLGAWAVGLALVCRGELALGMLFFLGGAYLI